MLRRISAALAVLIGVVPLVVAPAPAAAQEGSVVCAEYDQAMQVCLLQLTVNFSGNPPTVNASVSGGGCGVQVWCDRGPTNYRPGQLREVPCQVQYGWYSQAYDCYFREQSSVTPEDRGVILPGGYEPGDDGAVYEAMCYTPRHPDIPTDNYCFYCTPPGWNLPVQYVFLSSSPDGYGGTPDPVPDLLVSAISDLALEGPAIRTAPPASAAGLVRLPVWLWNDTTGNNWGEPGAEAGPIAGISVVAQARAVGIEWEMGDGSTLSCDEGVAWQPGMPIHSPPCGHTYLRASRDQPGGRYQISATTTWVLEWSTAGTSPQRGGEFELQVTSTESLLVNELQVLTTFP